MGDSYYEIERLTGDLASQLGRGFRPVNLTKIRRKAQRNFKVGAHLDCELLNRYDFLSHTPKT